MKREEEQKLFGARLHLSDEMKQILNRKAKAPCTERTDTHAQKSALCEEVRPDCHFPLQWYFRAGKKRVV